MLGDCASQDADGILRKVSPKDPFEGVAPVSIAGNADARSMSVTWNDGHVNEFTYEWLRWHCPCANCAGEGGEPGILAFTKQLADNQTQLEDLQLVGSYALTPVWADGHHTGIYSYRYLRQNCPCPECVASREEATVSGG